MFLGYVGPKMMKWEVWELFPMQAMNGELLGSFSLPFSIFEAPVKVNLEFDMDATK